MPVVHVRSESDPRLQEGAASHKKGKSMKKAASAKSASAGKKSPKARVVEDESPKRQPTTTKEASSNFRIGRQPSAKQEQQGRNRRQDQNGPRRDDSSDAESGDSGRRGGNHQHHHHDADHRYDDVRGHGRNDRREEWWEGRHADDRRDRRDQRDSVDSFTYSQSWQVDHRLSPVGDSPTYDSEEIRPPHRWNGADNSVEINVRETVNTRVPPKNWADDRDLKRFKEDRQMERVHTNSRPREVWRESSKAGVGRVPSGHYEGERVDRARTQREGPAVDRARTQREDHLLAQIIRPEDAHREEYKEARLIAYYREYTRGQDMGMRGPFFEQSIWEYYMVSTKWSDAMCSALNHCKLVPFLVVPFLWPVRLLWTLQRAAPVKLRCFCDIPVMKLCNFPLAVLVFSLPFLLLLFWNQVNLLLLAIFGEDRQAERVVAIVSLQVFLIFYALWLWARLLHGVGLKYNITQAVEGTHSFTAKAMACICAMNVRVGLHVDRAQGYLPALRAHVPVVELSNVIQKAAPVSAPPAQHQMGREPFV